MSEDTTLLHEGLGRVEAKVDVLLERTAAQDYRLRVVERKQWFTSGSIAVAVALLVPKIKAFLGF